MTFRTLKRILLATMMSSVVGCAILDGESGGADNGSDATAMAQPAFLQPTFVLAGTDALPRGIRLDELHLGVGALFLDLVDDTEGSVAYANRTPFQLHFDIRGGQLVAQAPPMILPHGGTYQVSLQLEPAMLLEPAEAAAAMSHSVGLASLVVAGRVSRTTYPSDDDEGIDEPAPLPWYPDDVDDMRGLRRSTEALPFTYASARSMRFIVGEVTIDGGSHSSLKLQLQIDTWVAESILPAIRLALVGRPVADSDDRPVDVENLDLSEQMEEIDEGMDGLIGGIDIEVEEL